MAAHTYRTWLWHQVGFATWNAQWYGGHHMAGYSLLYPPLAARRRHAARRRGRRASSRSWLFARLARRRAPTPAAGRARRVAVPRRRDEQRGDRADAVHARHRARRRRLGLRAALARRAPPRCRSRASGRARWPGVFLVVGRRRRARGARPRGDAGRAPGRLAHRARARRAGGGGRARDGAAVPRGRPGPLRRHRVLADAARLPAPRSRSSTRAARDRAVGRRRSTSRVLVAAFALPNSLGQNALRPGRSARPGAARALRPPARAAGRGRGRGRRPALPAVAARRARRRGGARRPVHRAGLPRRGPALPRRRARSPGERRRGAADAQPLGGRLPGAGTIPLARGWHRQLDRKVNPLFYGTAAGSTPARYERWLRDNAVRWVALPDAPLDFSARPERRLLRAALPSCGRVYALAATGGSGRCATPAARVGPGAPDRRGRRRLRPARRSRPGWVLVRQHGTPYWTVTRRRRLRARDRAPGWTLVDVRRAGLLRVRARFSARGALRREPRCATPPPDRSAVRPTPL